MKVERLKYDASTKAVIDKINEIVDAINSSQPVYTPPRAYDLNAINKIKHP